MVCMPSVPRIFLYLSRPSAGFCGVSLTYMLAAVDPFLVALEPDPRVDCFCIVHSLYGTLSATNSKVLGVLRENPSIFMFRQRGRRKSDFEEVDCTA